MISSLLWFTFGICSGMWMSYHIHAAWVTDLQKHEHELRTVHRKNRYLREKIASMTHDHRAKCILNSSLQRWERN